MRLLPYGSTELLLRVKNFLVYDNAGGYSVFRSHMADTLDLVAFGERLRKTRLKRGLTLQQVFEQIAVSVPTLSRIERGEAAEIESKTLIVLAKWMQVNLELFSGGAKALSKKQNTPDAVELHLRADKNLNPQTATALAKMFRAAYEELAEKMPKG
jgi:transcriptional regulator with XRE-family HTH domain